MFDIYQFYEIETLQNQGRVMEANVLLRELKQSYLDVQNECNKLRNQVHYLEELLYVSRNLIFDGDAYWFISEGQKQGPFCPKCYHDKGSLIRLQIKHVSGFDLSLTETWTCDSCGLNITTETLEPESASDTTQAVTETTETRSFMQ